MVPPNYIKGSTIVFRVGNFKNHERIENLCDISTIHKTRLSTQEANNRHYVGKVFTY